MKTVTKYLSDDGIEFSMRKDAETWNQCAALRSGFKAFIQDDYNNKSGRKREANNGICYLVQRINHLRPDLLPRLIAVLNEPKIK